MASIQGIPVLGGRRDRSDHVATVFVDDAVNGHLPPVCVKTGAPADGFLPITVNLGRFNPLWLLFILLGPIGWVILAVVTMVGNRREQLMVRLPMSTPMMEAYVRSRRRLAIAGSLALAACFVLPLMLTVGSRVSTSGESGSSMSPIVATALGIVAIAAVTLVVRSLWSLGRTQVGIELDASRRWVTLRDVAPEFAAQTRTIANETVRL